VIWLVYIIGGCICLGLVIAVWEQVTGKAMGDLFPQSGLNELPLPGSKYIPIGTPVLRLKDEGAQRDRGDENTDIVTEGLGRSRKRFEPPLDPGHVTNWALLKPEERALWLEAMEHQ